MIDLAVTGWYQSLVDDCRATLTESLFNSRWELLAGYHAVGKRIVTDENYQKFSKGNRTLCNDIANNLGVSERTMYYIIKFYETYPDLNTLPDGKNVSWYKVTNQLLPGTKEENTKTTHWTWHWKRAIKEFSALSSFDGSVPPKIKALMNEVIELSKIEWGEWR